MSSILHVAAGSDKQSANMSSSKKFRINSDLTLEDLHAEGDAEKIEQGSIQIPEKGSQNITITVFLYNNFKNIHVEVRDLKAMVYLEELLRIFEFCYYVPDSLVENDLSTKISKEDVLASEESAAFMTFTLVATESHICIPSGEEHVLILKCMTFFLIID